MSAYMTYLESFSAPLTPNQMVEMGIISLKTYKKIYKAPKKLADMTPEERKEVKDNKVMLLDQPTFPAKRRILLKKKPVA